MHNQLPGRPSWHVLVPLLAILSACTTVPATIHVDTSANDTTAPTVLWLQAAVAGKPNKIVMLKDLTPSFPDISVEMRPPEIVTVTAMAKDDESGIRRLEIAGLVTAYKLTANNTWHMVKNHIPDNFGAYKIFPANLPQDYPVSSRVETQFNFAALAQEFDWIIIHLQAVAESGAPPSSNTPAVTNIMTLFYKKPGSPPP